MKIGRLNIEISWDKGYMSEVKKSIKEDKMLMAIKIYKDNTGYDLMTSKDFVFALRDKLNSK